MKTLQIITMLALGVFAMSCGNQAKKDKQAEHQSYYEVMAVHDNAMQRMGELSKVHRELEKKLTTIDSTQTAPREEISKAIVDLEYADGRMMDWMAKVKQLDDLRKEKSHEELMAYLGEEKQRVDSLMENIVTSIDTGKRLLGEQSNQ